MQTGALTALRTLPWIWFLLALTPLSAQTMAHNEYEHRALYLYNFAKFTHWPKEVFPNEGSPFVLGILGKDPFEHNIDIIKDKFLKNRKIVIKHYSTLAEVDNCQLLFISSSEEGQMDQILFQLQKRPILTVSEVKNAASPRAMINLYVNGKYLAFEIDKPAADRAGLKLDTRLLRLAKPSKKNKEAPL